MINYLRYPFVSLLFFATLALAVTFTFKNSNFYMAQHMPYENEDTIELPEPPSLSPALLVKLDEKDTSSSPLQIKQLSVNISVTR